MEIRACPYQLKLVEGLGPGVQYQENALGNQTDETMLISKWISRKSNFTYRISHGNPMYKGNDTIPLW